MGKAEQGRPLAGQAALPASSSVGPQIALRARAWAGAANVASGRAAEQREERRHRAGAISSSLDLGRTSFSPAQLLQPRVEGVERQGAAIVAASRRVVPGAGLQITQQAQGDEVVRLEVQRLEHLRAGGAAMALGLQRAACR